MFNTNKFNYGDRVLAENYRVSDDTELTHLNNNDLIIGPPGAGKTGGYVIPNILEASGSIIVADTKRNLCRKLGPAMEAKGYKIYVIDFVDQKNSYAYNPLDYIRRDENGVPSETDIASVAEMIVPVHTDKDPFWEKSAQQILGTLIGFTLDVFPPEEQNLYTVNSLYALMISQGRNSTSNNNPIAGIQFLDEYALKNPDSFAARQYKMFRGTVGVDKTWNCILQFLSNGISMFGLDGPRNLFSGSNKFRITDISHEKSVIFLNISDCDRTFDNLLNLFYSQSLRELMMEADRNIKNGSRLDVPVRMFLDDFATNTIIPHFKDIISTIRSRDISVSIIIQSLSQLYANYSAGEAETIIDTCDHVLYLGGSNLKTIEYISVRAGKTRDKVMAMPLDKVYLLERGKPGMLMDKIKPYSFDLSAAGKEVTADSKTVRNDDYPF